MTIDDCRGEASIRVLSDALRQAELHAIEAAPHEVGGILVGWWDGDLNAHVLDLLPVADRSVGQTHYERRQRPAQQVLDVFRRACTDPAAGYIGEWHSHPAPQPPSPTDRTTLSSIVRDTRRPVALLVLAVVSSGEVEAYGLVGRPRWSRRVAISPTRIERI